MPPGKAHNYLASFIREGLVHQDEATGHYGLGPFATLIGLAAIREHDVIGLCSQPIEELRAATGCAAYVSVWGDLGPVIAYRKDGDRQGSMTIRVGHVMPLLFSATGHVFLAYLSPQVTDRLVLAQTRDPMGLFPPINAKNARKRAREITAAVRARGVAVSEGAVNAGFYAVAAPIFDHGGGIMAALAVLGPSVIMTTAAKHKAESLLRKLADRVSARLGYQANLRGPSE
jgi:DNA-binding IclR family transcriptional regulator